MTQPADKPPGSTEVRTRELPAMTDRAILEDLVREARANGKTLERLDGTVASLVVDGRELHTRMGMMEGRVARLETPTTPPITSERVRSMTSEVDLKAQSALSEEIVKRQSAEAEIAVLKATMVTKAEMVKITEDQTSAVVEGIREAAKNPTVQKIGWALAALLLVAINAATTYITTRGH